MLRFTASRLLQALISIVLVAIIVFGLSRVTGDPVRLMLPTEATAADRALLRARLGLDKPTIVQLGHFLVNASHLNLGTSFRYNQPVLNLILSRLPYSILLAMSAMFLAVLIGVPIGIAAARHPDGAMDKVAKTFAVAGQSIPTFVVGIVLILLFAVRFHWFPPGDSGNWKHLVLPAITLGWYSTAALTRISRSSMLEALSSDYVKVARSKGLPERLVLVRHALRNSLTAILSLSALQFVTLINGAVITEAVFNWPGVGSLIVQAAFGRDYALVQGLVLVAAGMTIFINLATDLLYAWIDPRISVSA